jgi:Na+-driven multidrug efflux pump
MRHVRAVTHCACSRSLVATLLSMAVNLGLNLWLIPLPGWGVNGAALASTVSYSVSTGILTVLFVRWSGLPLRAVLVPTRADLGEVLARAARLRSRGTRLLHRGAAR